MYLSSRLQFIYENLLSHQVVWDLCCDHGLLGQAAARSGLFGEVNFVDQVPHIITKLETKLQKMPGIEKCKFRIADAENLQEPLFGNVVIAGVGAHQIFKILKGLQARNFLQAQRLILAPQREEEKLRHWLLEQDSEFKQKYVMYAEKSLKERSRNRLIFVFDCSK
jgi:tRNA (adenine22-N1)-methyltransferase